MQRCLEEDLEGRAASMPDRKHKPGLTLTCSMRAFFFYLSNTFCCRQFVGCYLNMWHCASSLDLCPHQCSGTIMTVRQACVAEGRDWS